MSSSHYKTLGLARTATLEELKHSYKSLALQHHPDKNPNNVHASTEKFKKINKSYEYLLKAMTEPEETIPEPAAQPDTRATRRAARSAPEPEAKAWKKKSKAARQPVRQPEWRKPAPKSTRAKYGRQSEHSYADGDEAYACFEEPEEVYDDPDWYITDFW